MLSPLWYFFSSSKAGLVGSMFSPLSLDLKRTSFHAGGRTCPQGCHKARHDALEVEVTCSMVERLVERWIGLRNKKKRKSERRSERQRLLENRGKRERTGKGKRVGDIQSSAARQREKDTRHV